MDARKTIMRRVAEQYERRTFVGGPKLARVSPYDLPVYSPVLESLGIRVLEDIAVASGDLKFEGDLSSNYREFAVDDTAPGP